MPDVLTLWSLAVLVVGGLMYLIMSRSPTTSTKAIAVRRPGWIARRRARGGIRHRHDRVGVGYVSATSSVHLSLRELAGHGLTVGGPGSGKTTFLQLLVEASAARMPVVILDPKGSPALEETVRAHDGVVWTLDGKVPADLLDPRPWQVPDLLLEAEDYSADARAYRDAAHQRALWAAWALALDSRPMNLADLRRLLDREQLLKALEPHRWRDPRVQDWLHRLEHQHGGIEDSGARGLDRALGTLLDGVALRGSLKHCAQAIRLEDVVDTNGLVLFKLDAAEYPHATRKIASWVLLGMGRVARTLVTSQPLAALLLVDEVGALGSSARHLRGLVGRAREAGLAVVLATQGPSDLEAVDHALLPQVLQDTAWQLAFRQGSPQDAERFRLRMLRLLSLADVRKSHDPSAGLDIVIIGGGATGVELAAELREASAVHGRYGFRHLDPHADVRIRILEGAPRVLAPLAENVSAAAARLLAQRHVSIVTSCKVVRIEADAVVDAEGRNHAAKLCVWAAGIKAPPLLAQVGLPVTRSGQVQVDGQLRVDGVPDVFALGDCAFCAQPDGKSVPPRAQSAHQQANYLYALLQSTPGTDLSTRPPYRYKDHGSLVSIGSGNTVGSLMGGQIGRAHV